MKKVVFLVAIVLVSIFSTINATFAHNGINEQSEKIDFSGEWNLLLAGLLVIIYIFYHIQFHKEQGFIKKSIFFFLSLLVVYLALGSPLHVLGAIISVYGFTAIAFIQFTK